MFPSLQRDPQKQLEKDNRKFRERKQKEQRRQRALENETTKIVGKIKR